LADQDAILELKIAQVPGPIGRQGRLKEVIIPRATVRCIGANESTKNSETDGEG
jgi:hypothetical protein